MRSIQRLIADSTLAHKDPGNQWGMLKLALQAYIGNIASQQVAPSYASVRAQIRTLITTHTPSDSNAVPAKAAPVPESNTQALRAQTDMLEVIKTAIRSVMDSNSQRDNSRAR